MVIIPEELIFSIDWFIKYIMSLRLLTGQHMKEQ